MISKYFLIACGIMLVNAGRLENTYLPPSGAGTSGGNGNILGAPTTGVQGIQSDVENNPDAGAKILKFENENNGDGSYKFEYETDNQIQHSESGELKNVGEENEAMTVQGSYSYMGPDGVMYTVTYIADENGFRATGDHIPTAPPVPEDIQKALDKIAEMDAGSTDDNNANDQNGVNANGSYRKEHNQDTQSVVIEAEPQYQQPQSANREYLPPQQQQADVDVPSNGYRY